MLETTAGKAELAAEAAPAEAGETTTTRNSTAGQAAAKSATADAADTARNAAADTAGNAAADTAGNAAADTTRNAAANAAANSTAAAAALKEGDADERRVSAARNLLRLHQ